MAPLFLRGCCASIVLPFVYVYEMFLSARTMIAQPPSSCGVVHSCLNFCDPAPESFEWVCELFRSSLNFCDPAPSRSGAAKVLCLRSGSSCF